MIVADFRVSKTYIGKIIKKSRIIITFAVGKKEKEQRK